MITFLYYGCRTRGEHMRITKEHDVRRNEILDTAEMLFETKGYSNTTVNDILREVNIAKGTFYYYFKSKEEVLDAVIERHLEKGLERAEAVKKRKDLSPAEKLTQVVLVLRMAGPKSEVVDELHKPENALMHQKSLGGIIRGLVPILNEIVEEGIRAGVFSTPFPEQTVRIMLAAALTLTDDAMFSYTQEERQQLLEAIVYSLETLLGAERGSLGLKTHLLQGERGEEEKA